MVKRETFFDQIDEFIQYPPDLWQNEFFDVEYDAIGIANGKIISYEWRTDVKRLYEHSFSFNRSKWANSSVESTDEVDKINLDFKYCDFEYCDAQDTNFKLHFLRVENLQKERYDSIFLISRMSYWKTRLYEYVEYGEYGELSEYQYRIFGISETNSGVQLKSYGDFGSRTFPVKLGFPQVITPTKNGKFLFYPQSIDSGNYKEKVSKPFAIEEWHHDEDLTRSSIIFPVNFTNENFDLWILKA